MKIILITLWLAVPLAVAAYHFGPGQELLKGDAAAAHVTDATRSAATGDHKAAIAAYDAALGALPTAAVAESRQLRLARAKERLPNGQLPEAHDELEALFAELTADRAADPVVKQNARLNRADGEAVVDERRLGPRRAAIGATLEIHPPLARPLVGLVAGRTEDRAVGI